MSAIEYSAEDLEVRSVAALVSLHEAPYTEAIFDAQVQGRAIARRFGVSYELMTSGSRFGNLPKARRALYLVLKRQGWSYPQIGAFVGHRDHTTVMSSIGKTAEMRRAALSGAA